jgi:Domain of unknown function (DUF5664)
MMDWKFELDKLTIRKDTNKKQEAKRDNAGKTPYAFLPMDLLDGAARVMAFGATKYGLNNFRKGYSDLKSPLNSLLRHAVAVQTAVLEGDGNIATTIHAMADQESGESHIDHIITSALLLKQALRVKQKEAVEPCLWEQSHDQS